MKIIKKNFENKNFRVLGNILWKNCWSIKKFEYTISWGPWHGMAHHLLVRQGKYVWLMVRHLPIKAGWWDDAPLVILDLEEAIYMYVKI